MQASLQYGRKYRAKVVLEPFAKLVITDEMIAAELAEWQLRGQVAESLEGYIVEAEFTGKSGTYDLPEEVQSVEIIG